LAYNTDDITRDSAMYACVDRCFHALHGHARTFDFLHHIVSLSLSLKKTWQSTVLPRPLVLVHQQNHGNSFILL
jgi:hypothetical protein